MGLELVELLNVFVGDAVGNAKPHQFGGGFVLLVLLPKLLLNEDTEIGKRLVSLGFCLSIAQSRFVFTRGVEGRQREGKSQLWVFALTNL